MVHKLHCLVYIPKEQDQVTTELEPGTCSTKKFQPSTRITENTSGKSLCINVRYQEGHHGSQIEIIKFLQVNLEHSTGDELESKLTTYQKSAQKYSETSIIQHSIIRHS